MNQRQWRILGAIVLACSAAMAIFAIVTETLRNTVLVLVDASTPKSLEGADDVAVTPLVLFWLVFALLISTALYLAIKDFRYIRQQYSVERREMIRRALQDEAIRNTLAAAQAETDRSGN